MTVLISSRNRQLTPWFFVTAVLTVGLCVGSIVGLAVAWWLP